MSINILIDAKSKSEMRGVIVKNKIIQNFECDSFDYNNIKGNIYLAKVMRIEPSYNIGYFVNQKNEKENCNINLWNGKIRKSKFRIFK